MATSEFSQIEKKYDKTVTYVRFWEGDDEDPPTVSLDGVFDADQLRELEIAMRRCMVDRKAGASDGK